MDTGKDAMFHILSEHSNQIEIVRNRQHDMANSLASTSSVLVTFTDNMKSVIDTLKNHAEELDQLQKLFNEKKTISATLKKVAFNPLTLFLAGWFLFTFEKVKFIQFYDYVRGVLP